MTSEAVQPILLAGKAALVIGAGTPAGRVAALALARAGADVACASASIDGDEVMAGRRTRRTIEAMGRRTAEYAFDLTLGANVRVSTRQVAREMGRLDILVNAADSYLRKSAEQTTDAEWSKVLSVNLGGVFFACRAALKEMAESGGRIITICSVLAEHGAEQSAAYCAAQHGIAGLTRALAAEYADRGIRINALALDRQQPAAASATVSAAADHRTQDALGPLVVYLASAAGDMVNGQIIAVDAAAPAPR